MRKIISTFIVFLLSFFMFSVGSVSAKVLTNQEGNITVAKGEVINDDLFVGAKTFTLDGTVNGDVFVAAETVSVKGTVNGSLHAGAGTLDLSGTVKGNAYIGAGTVTVSKTTVGGSLLIGSGNATVDNGSVVTGSVLVGAGNVTIDSVVKRNVLIGAGNATLGAKANIGKDLYYALGNERGEIDKASTAVVSGVIHKTEAQANKVEIDKAQKEMTTAFRTLGATAKIVGFLGALIVGYLYLKFFKKNSTDSANLVTTSFWKSLGIGLLIIIAALPVLFVLVITGIGASLAGMLLLLLLIGWYLAKIVVGLALGAWIAKKFNWNKVSTFMTFALGLLVIYLCELVPVVSAFVGIAVLWSGLGALARTLVSKPE